jgi:hypothetical protein
LKAAFGPGFESMLDSDVAQLLRFNSVMSDIKSTSSSALGGFFNDLLQGRSAADALHNSLTRLESKLADMAANALISNLFKNLIGAGLGGIGGGTAGGTPLPALTGGFHSGGIVGNDGRSQRSVSPFLFAGAPRFHDGGIVSGEVPVIARQGEGIFTSAQMKSLAPAGQGQGGGGGNNVSVVVNNQSPNSTVETRKSSQGGVDVHEITIKAVDSAMASGRFDGTMRARYNSQPQPRAR